MGFYAKCVLPRLIDLAMRNKDTARLRAECVPQARGDVLEIGIGSGLNLPFYSSEVRQLCGIDPSIELQRMAQKKAASVPFKITFISQSAEEPFPFENSSIDTIVMTWILCSIPNPGIALQQMRRVLKPEGRMIYIEHGRSPDQPVVKWQDRLTPVWKKLGGGCHLNRKIDDLITTAGFEISDQTKFYLSGPHPLTYTYKGIAHLR